MICWLSFRLLDLVTSKIFRQKREIRSAGKFYQYSLLERIVRVFGDTSAFAMVQTNLSLIRRKMFMHLKQPLVVLEKIAHHGVKRYFLTSE